VELFRIGLLASWMIGANVQAERFVALQLEGAHHFIERRACGRTRGFEQPSTFGATKAPKTRLLNPYQFLVHGRLLVSAENRHPVWAQQKMHKVKAKCTRAKVDSLSGILHRRGSDVAARTCDFAG